MGFILRGEGREALWRVVLPVGLESRCSDVSSNFGKNDERFGSNHIKRNSFQNLPSEVLII